MQSHLQIVCTIVSDWHGWICQTCIRIVVLRWSDTFVPFRPTVLSSRWSKGKRLPCPIDMTTMYAIRSEASRHADESIESTKVDEKRPSQFPDSPASNVSRKRRRFAFDPESYDEVFSARILFQIIQVSPAE
jgi:hypothetical protein